MPKYQPGDIVEFHHKDEKEETQQRVLILSFVERTREKNEIYWAWWLIDTDDKDCFEGTKDEFVYELGNPDYTLLSRP